MLLSFYCLKTCVMNRTYPTCAKCFAKRLVKRDFLREAVFLCTKPLEEALSKARVALLNANFAVSASVLKDSSKRRIVVRREDLAAAFLMVRTLANSTLLIADLMFGTDGHPLRNNLPYRLRKSHFNILLIIFQGKNEKP